jgi:hypothetical protein
MDTASTNRGKLGTGYDPVPFPVAESTPATSRAGEYDILLVADRQAGTMYHFFRNWRFESLSARDADSAPLVAVPIDPQEMVASGTRYTMEFVGERPAATARGTAAFTWSVAFAGAWDPLADGLGRAQRLLAQAGWTQDALAPTRFTGDAS